MPKYNIGKSCMIRFKVQGLIKNKDHLDFYFFKFLQGDSLRNFNITL
jgi:hypothetical protein